MLGEQGNKNSSIPLPHLVAHTGISVFHKSIVLSPDRITEGTYIVVVVVFSAKNSKLHS